MASRVTTGSKGITKVRTARRSTGGVAIRLSSLTPENAICKVRGMGVAVSVSTWTSLRSCFRRSLWATPKCCSSSITSRVKLRKSIFLPSRAWVPITISICPLRIPSRVDLASAVLTRRDNCRTSTGMPAKRTLKVWKCCRLNNVVGATMATCPPDMTVGKAARMATSVLPNPTSPQTKRSMGEPFCKSAKISLIALN